MRSRTPEVKHHLDMSRQEDDREEKEEGDEDLGDHGVSLEYRVNWLTDVKRVCPGPVQVPLLLMKTYRETNRPVREGSQ